MREDSKSVGFPSVFLTLISIVIALGIEQLLGQVSTQLAGAAGVARFLIAAQGVTMFLTIGAIWIAYATMVMAGAWEPRFQDFFVPLFILSLLYFGILAIGTSGPAWFYLMALGTINAAVVQRFDFPRAVTARLRSSSPEGRRNIYCLVACSLLSAVGGVTTQLGALDVTGSAALVSILAAVVFLQAWFQFQWWRAAQQGVEPDFE